MPRLLPMAKLSKKEVDYSLGMINSHCGKVFTNDKGHCRHFSPNSTSTDPGSCELVDGEIDPIYWCRKFSKASS